MKRFFQLGMTAITPNTGDMVTGKPKLRATVQAQKTKRKKIACVPIKLVVLLFRDFDVVVV